MGKRSWHASVPLVASPAIAVLLWLFAERPAEVDWQGDSLPARVLDTLLVLQAIYSIVLVAVMSGRRIEWAILGLVAFLVSFAINFAAWWCITGVYF
jgi:hypothetical protein